MGTSVSGWGYGYRYKCDAGQFLYLNRWVSKLKPARMKQMFTNSALKDLCAGMFPRSKSKHSPCADKDAVVATRTKVLSQMDPTLRSLVLGKCLQGAEEQNDGHITAIKETIQEYKETNLEYQKTSGFSASVRKL